MELFPLLDKYHAFQALDDAWDSVAADLEMLQTEGFEAARVVDPRLVIKKKNGKDVEVQEGWQGHVIPFDLVQDLVLADELEALRGLTEDLACVEGEAGEACRAAEASEGAEVVGERGGGRTGACDG